MFHLKIAPSEFWGLSLWEWLVMYEHARASQPVGRIKQSDVDRLLARQELIDKGENPWQ